MKLLIEIKPTKNLSKKEVDFMNKARNKEYGKGSSVNFKKDDAKGEFIFVKLDGKIKSFGMMKPVNIVLGKEKYSIMGIGRGMAIEKRKGWGKLLNNTRILRLKELRKTGIAFTSKENFGFFEKAGYKIKKNGIRKFRYKNPQTGELIKDDDGGFIYYEGKDKFVTRLMKSKFLAITDTDFW